MNLREHVELRLDILALQLTTHSRSPFDVEVALPVAIHMRDDGMIEFLLMGPLDMTREFQEAVLTESMEAVAEAILEELSVRFPSIRVEARRDLVGYWYPGPTDGPEPRARWEDAAFHWEN